MASSRLGEVNFRPPIKISSLSLIYYIRICNHETIMGALAHGIYFRGRQTTGVYLLPLGAGRPQIPAHFVQRAADPHYDEQVSLYQWPPVGVAAPACSEFKRIGAGGTFGSNA